MVHANGSEEELKMVEEQGNALNQQESSEDISASVPVKRGRGRPKGSKKPQISVPDVNLMEIVSGIANSNPALDFINASGGEDRVPKKRGRPKGSGSKRSVEKEADQNGLDTPKRGVGRPKGSGKRKAEKVTSEDESDNSAKKEPRVERDGDDDPLPNGIAAPRGRGRPRKSTAERRAPPGPKRGRGRPKKHLVTGGAPAGRRARGRPRKSDAVKRPAASYDGPPRQRGRPRKHPSLAKPKMWKPLGRPRKYPVVEPPEGATAPPRRKPGRPRKSETKRGAHLRNPASTRPPGRPPSTPGDDGAPRKRGRPKGSGKNEVQSEAPLDGSPLNHSDDAGEERREQEAGERRDDAPAQQREENAGAEEGATAQE
ncbi:uncharacterized protein LOC144008018 [Festucalex cinctus]